MQKENLNMIVADDHLMLLELLRDVIKLELNCSNIDSVCNYREMIDALNVRPDYDLALMDYKMPGVNGMVGIKYILSNYPQVDLVIMSGLANFSEVDEFMNLGVKGFIPKTSSPHSSICAIKLVLEGEKFIPSSFYKRDASMTAPNITPRESQVLRKLHIGYPNKQIAQSLDLQEVTVKMHISRLCKKLNAKNRTQLLVNAINQNLV